VYLQRSEDSDYVIKRIFSLSFFRGVAIPFQKKQPINLSINSLEKHLRFLSNYYLSKSGNCRIQKPNARWGESRKNRAGEKGSPFLLSSFSPILIN